MILFTLLGEHHTNKPVNLVFPGNRPFGSFASSLFNLLRHCRLGLFRRFLEFLDSFIDCIRSTILVVYIPKSSNARI